MVKLLPFLISLIPTHRRLGWWMERETQETEAGRGSAVGGDLSLKSVRVLG